MYLLFFCFLILFSCILLVSWCLFIANSVGIEWNSESCRLWWVFQLVYELVWAWILVINCFFTCFGFGVNWFLRILISWLYNCCEVHFPVCMIDLQDFIFKVSISGFVRYLVIKIGSFYAERLGFFVRTVFLML